MQLHSRADRLAETLRGRIQDGVLPLGAKLASEQAIAAEFQVSRTVVREAVARLKSDGLLETRKGAATRVSAPSQGAGRALSMPRSIDGLLGFLEVRRSFETEMAALAAARRSDRQCREVEAALLSIDRATQDGSSGVQEDLDFHLAIGHATANAYWPQFVRLFAEPMRSAIGVTRANEARRKDFALAVADEHRRIYDAILHQDPEDAREAVRQHLVNAARRITQADTEFWQHEGGDLAQLWATQALSKPAGRQRKP